MTELCVAIDAVLDETRQRRTFLQVDNRTVSYPEICSAIRGLISYFEKIGLTQQDRIGVLFRDPADISALVLAAMRAGLGVVVLNPDMTDAEVKTASTACGLKHLFHEVTSGVTSHTPDALEHTAVSPWLSTKPSSGLLGRLRKKSAAETIPTLLSLVDGLPSINPPADLSGDMIALMLNTSGTTSVPKVVELSHDNIIAQLAIFAEVYDINGDARILNPLPMYFTDGLFHGPINTFLNMATLFRPVEFDITQLEELLHGVYRDAITHLIVVPAILALMDRLGNEFTDTFRDEKFRYIRSSGDRLPASLWRSIETRFGVRIANTYGMSETVCEVFFSGPDDATHRIGTVGKAVGCEWKIVGENGQDLAAGGTGELLLKGGVITRGYRDQPKLTAESCTDGWFRTGDVATASDDGFVTISGRQKELIIAGGVNIHPQEITDCLLECNGVADAIAFGLPHGVWGEQVAAAIVPRQGVELSRADVLAHCRDLLAPHKVPRVTVMLDELPRNSAGKVLVKQLRAECQSHDASDGSASETSISNRVLSEAAQVFGVPVETLHLSSEPANTRGWDSFAHLTLITSLESQFGVTLSARELLRVGKLADIADILTKKAG